MRQVAELHGWVVFEDKLGRPKAAWAGPQDFETYDLEIVKGGEWLRLDSLDDLLSADVRALVNAGLCTRDQAIRVMLERRVLASELQVKGVVHNECECGPMGTLRV